VLRAWHTVAAVDVATFTLCYDLVVVAELYRGTTVARTAEALSHSAPYGIMSVTRTYERVRYFVVDRVQEF